MKLASLQPTRVRLPSGLRIIVTPMPAVHRTVLTAHLRVGSRYESAEQNGISHFLEHMLFRGTPSFASAHELAVAFESLGGTLVAATAADHGTLAIGVPPENLDAVLGPFAEVYMQPILEGIDVERGIVREEILEGLDDSGRSIDGENLVRELSFGDHGLGRPITGELYHLERFSVPSLRQHHARHYVGSSTIVSVAGPVDPDAVIARIEQCFAGLAAGEVPQAPAPSEQSEGRFRFVRHESSSQTALHLGFRGPRDRDPREPAVDMLLRVIDDGMATRLYHELCDSRGLCYDASASYETYADTGLIEFATGTGHEHAETVLGHVLRLTEELASSGPTEEELQRAQKRCRWQHEGMLDEPGEVAEYLALSELTGVAPTPEARLDQLSAVTRADVQAAAAAFFDRRALSTVVVGLQKNKAVDRLERLCLG